MQGLEGVIAKHRRSIYEPGRRSRSWLKVKIRPEQELVVGGWTPGEGAAKDLGRARRGLLRGRREAERSSTSRARSGPGSRGQTRKVLRERLAKLAIDDSPFDPPPPKDYKGRWGGELKYVVWVKPEIVIRAELGGWTRDGIVRQAAFKGFDEGGKPPIQVVRERPVATTETVEGGRGDPARRRRRRIRATLARCRRSPPRRRPPRRPTAEQATTKQATAKSGGREAVDREEVDRSLAIEPRVRLGGLGRRARRPRRR